MKAEDRQRFLKQALLGFWAMLTVILVMALALIVFNMVQQGQSPFPVLPAGAQASSAQPGAETPALSETRRDVPLFFASEDGRLLVPEIRVLTLGEDTIANYHTALDALIQGPEGMFTPVAAPGTRVKGIFVMEDGELIVDMSMETVSGLRKQPSVSSEMLFLQSIVHTLSAPELLGADATPVAKVQILIEGASAEESFKDAHCDWASPLVRDPHWLAGNEPLEPQNG
ncbi:MAG TPA: GerMN domain-containing protein [Candidatus Hydrogenedentes bacterium]|nr:GerMN domain-containing protein [Candidatus Hydrogenedentota bacterium]